MPQNPAPHTEDRGVKSAERTLDLLELLAATGHTLTLSEIAAALEVPKSSAHGLLKTLERRGYAAASAGRYALGAQAARLARSYAHGLELTAQAEDLLDHLSGKTGENISLCVLVDFEVHDLARRESVHALRVMTGTPALAHASAGGKAILAAHSDADVRALFRGVKLEAATPRSLTGLKALLDDLAVTRRRGHAFEDEESVLGVQAIGAPVRDASGTVAALVLSAPGVRMNRKGFVPLVLEAARTLSSRLGA